MPVSIEKRDLLYIVLSRLEASLLAGDALSRRALQDLVFVAQSWGLPLEYGFSFSLKGPHSNSLLPDILHLQQRRGSYQRRTRTMTLTTKAERQIALLKGFIDEVKEDRRRLHLVSSVMFLGPRLGLDKHGIVAHFQRYAPEYFPFEIAEVVDLINERTPVRIP